MATPTTNIKEKYLNIFEEATPTKRNLKTYIQNYLKKQLKKIFEEATPTKRYLKKYFKLFEEATPTKYI